MIQRRQDLTVIIESVVSSMTFPMTIMDVVENPDLTITIEVCDLRHTEPGRIVSIGGNDYTVISIDDTNNTMILSAGHTITATDFDLYGVYFFSGAPIDVEKQVTDITDATNKTPMVMLLVPYDETVNDDVQEAVDRESRIVLFFLTQANWDAWTTQGIMENAVRPMSRLQQQFQDTVRSDNRFSPDGQTYTITPRPKFGVYINNKGVQKAFQAMDLSGIQEDITLKVWKGCTFEVECPAPDTSRQFDNSFDNSFN
jgi:hypothetical protein